MENRLAHVSEGKKKEVEEIKNLIKKYKVMAVINMENLPAAQFLKIKYKLKDKIFLKYTKKRLIKIAFDQLAKEKKDIVKLKDMLKGIPALLFTNEDEFKLQKLLRKNKTFAFAKPGFVALSDIFINEGPTPFGPGPMIGEFGQLGIKTQVKENKIHIRETKLIISKDEVVKEKVASILSKLGIEPVEVGFNLTFTYKDGEILTGDVLSINEEEYLNNIKKAYSEALNLSVGIGYINKDDIDVLLRKAYLNALALETKVGKLEGHNKTEEKKEEKTEVIKEEQAVKKEEKPEVKVEIKEEKQVELKKEEIKEEKKEEKTEVIKEKVEAKLNANEVTEDKIKQAQDLLRQFTDKKIRGEI
ncbi:50S ribosomal protein L10 [Candidatus Woesearchaeota archaeon]|nr:50S ribosomal protein L10 [Candidatus Woesearchaeota archaeon]